MSWDSSRTRAITGGIWLIGLGILFATRLWFPGILFLMGITAMIEGWLDQKGWSAIQGGVWLIFIAFWAMARFNLTFLFVGLGIAVILGALVKPNPFSKPYVDHSLD